MPTNQTYIRVLQAIELFASEHLQIQKFGSDFPSELPNLATADEAYPVLFVSPTNTIFDINATTYNIDVYCYDIIQKDRANINTILSDTNTILNDLKKWFTDAELEGLDVSVSSQAVPINNSLLDYAAGWVMTLTIEADSYSLCEVPFDNFPVVSGISNEIRYSRFLTCDGLTDCPTITGITSDIDTIFDILATGSTFDVFVTGGTFTAGTATFTNNTGGTFSVTGFTSGGGGGQTENFNWRFSTSTVSGDPSTGNFRLNNSNPSLATEMYLDSITDVAGFDISTVFNTISGNWSLYFQDTDDSTRNAMYSIQPENFIDNGGWWTLPLTLQQTSGVLPSNNQRCSFLFINRNTDTDIYVTGGTHNSATGVSTFTNNTGGIFTVSGYSTGGTSSGSATFTGGTVSGATVFTNGLTANTISATSITATNYIGLPLDVYVTGGTHVTATGISTFRNNTGGTFSVSGYSTGSSFTGGTVSGATVFTNGLTANTISATSITATTYYGLPVDVYVTGGTHTQGTTTFTNNTGGTFTVTGYSTGGTASGIDVYVTGGSHNNLTGVSTYTNNTGGTFTVTGLQFTGGTVSGGTRFLDGFTAATISATTYQNLPYWTAGTNTGTVTRITGANVVSGQHSVSVGHGCSSTGVISYSQGNACTASGDYSHAEGNSSTASNNGAHAEGHTTTASGQYSHAEGESTGAAGYASHAQGSGTQANGDYSHAEGSFTNANAHYAHAGGANTTVTGDYSFIHSISCNLNGENSAMFACVGLSRSQNNTVYVGDFVIEKNPALTVPSGAGDGFGNVGQVTWDDTYLYVKTNSGWGRILLDYAW